MKKSILVQKSLVDIFDDMALVSVQQCHVCETEVIASKNHEDEENPMPVLCEKCGGYESG